MDWNEYRFDHVIVNKYHIFRNNITVRLELEHPMEVKTTTKFCVEFVDMMLTHYCIREGIVSQKHKVFGHNYNFI